MPSIVLVILIILAAVLLLALDAFVAGEFYKAASAKGWGQKKYFWLAFLLTFAGYILIAALPDRGGEQMSVLISDDLPEL